MSATETVKKRLVMMNVVIVITSIIGVMSIVELRNGMHLHKLNFAHLNDGYQFENHLKDADFSSPADLGALKVLVSNVRAQPISCLEHHNFLTEKGTKALGTYRSFELCREDLVIADRALALLTSVENSDIDPEVVRADLMKIAHQFSEHSYQFDPLVSKTVDALLYFALFLMVLKGGSVIAVTLFSSRSILKHFKISQKMERELYAKNYELGNSIAALEKQKHEIDTAKQLAEHRSLHDPLTDLPNRRFLDRKMNAFQNSGRKIGLLHIDVDYFKQINDTKGHDAGDFILVHVAGILRRLIREHDFVARAGGDEFIVLACLSGVDDGRTQIMRLAERIIKAMRKPITYGGVPCRLSVSIGAALRVHDGDDMKSLFVNADLALYRAKVDGRNRYNVYDEALRNDVIERKSLSDEIITAIEQKQIVPFYQLQFEAETLAVSGMEALARWEHPSRGMISPAEFLPLAQELGLLGEIDQLIMYQAAEDLRALDAAGFHVPRVSVNISTQRLNEKRFINDLEKLKLPFNRIGFELLESIFLDNAEDKLLWTIDAIRELGIHLEIDDFGSGHASIIGLLDIRPNRFKIDRQLIRDIHKSESARLLVKSITDIGRSLNIEMVAEGIENAEHIEAIRKMDCRFVQGFALARPMNINDLHIFLRNRSWLNAA